MLTIRCLKESCGWYECTNDQISVCPQCSGPVVASLELKYEEPENVRALPETEF